MKKGLTELVVIIDKSGSMDNLCTDVIGGFNSLITEQKKADGDVLVTTVLFDTEVRVLNQRVDINKINKMTKKDYLPSGCTALLDAVGFGISYINGEHLKLEENEVPEHTIFSIMTDGLENASEEYDYKQIKTMISKQKEKGWDFLFRAANIDEMEEGAKLGISKNDILKMEATSKGVGCCFNMVSGQILKMRSIDKKKKG